MTSHDFTIPITRPTEDQPGHALASPMVVSIQDVLQKAGQFTQKATVYISCIAAVAHFQGAPFMLSVCKKIDDAPPLGPSSPYTVFSPDQKKAILGRASSVHLGANNFEASIELCSPCCKSQTALMRKELDNENVKCVTLDEWPPIDMTEDGRDDIFIFILWHQSSESLPTQAHGMLTLEMRINTERKCAPAAAKKDTGVHIVVNEGKVTKAKRGPKRRKY